MNQLTRVGCLMAAVLLAAATDTRAQVPQSQRATTIATFVVTSIGKLSITGTVSFLDNNPDTVNPVNSGIVTINVKARATAGIQLLVHATQQLTSASNDQITIDQLTWTCADAGFGPYSGQTMALTDKTLALWPASGAYTGSVTFHLANSWSYAAGTYSTTLQFTLTAP